MARQAKWSREVVDKWLKERGGELLTEDYTDGTQYIDYRCYKCHGTHTARFYYLLQRPSICLKPVKKVQYSKYTINDVRMWLHERGGELISTEYAKVTQKLRYICGDCGNEHEQSFSKMRENGMCNKGVRLDDEEIRRRIESVGKTFIEEVEKDKYGYRQYRCICICGEEVIGKIGSITKSVGCVKCVGNQMRTPFSEVRDAFDRLELDLLSDESEYESVLSKLRCRCRRCGFVGTTTYDGVKGRTNRKGGRPCNCGYMAGSTHYAWNFQMSDIDRKMKRRIEGYTQWRHAVYARDDNTCVCCGQPNLKGMNRHAHHLYNYGTYVDQRLDVANAVTLCRSCHEKFHAKYGRVDNRPEQFEEFKRNVRLKIGIDSVSKEADRNLNNVI